MSGFSVYADYGMMAKQKLKLIAMLTTLATISFCGGQTLEKEVVVIGGGIAGLSAARQILNRGLGNYTVRVYEARRERYGGRVWTNRLKNPHARGECVCVCVCVYVCVCMWLGVCVLVYMPVHFCNLRRVFEVLGQDLCIHVCKLLSCRLLGYMCERERQRESFCVCMYVCSYKCTSVFGDTKHFG